MNLAGKIAVGIATTLTIAGIVVATEGTTIVLTESINPQNLCTYVSFQSFSKKFDNRNQSSFKMISEFVNSNGSFTLVAESNKLPLQDRFIYTYRRSTNFLDDEDPTKLTNWDAVRKYMEIENESKKARQNGRTYYISNY